MKQKALPEEEKHCEISDARVLRHKKRLWVPKSLQKEVLKRAHKSSYLMHLGAIKIYQDLKDTY